MIGSPFYYDVLFDDGPGDVVFHDCMWSGICTCCIQLLHQDSYQFANESPDLKLEDSHCRTQINHVAHATHNQNTITSTTSASSHQLHQTQQQQQLQQQLSGRIGALDQPASISQRPSPDAANGLHDGSHHHPQHHLGGAAAALAQVNQCHRTCPDDSTTSSTITSSSATITLGARAAPANCLAHYQDINSSSASSSSSSPAPANSSSASSPHCNSHHSSSASSPKPIRRREHNDSERKRRDHLRNAFNFLRDQVPRFKTISKKPPRIQILHEATKYVQIVMREAEELERRLQEERTKHERNMKLSMK